MYKFSRYLAEQKKGGRKGNASWFKELGSNVRKISFENEEDDMNLGDDEENPEGNPKGKDVHLGDKHGDDDLSLDKKSKGKDGEDGEDKEEDPNFAGTIRYVEGAHLVYKRQEESEKYSELWVFLTGDGSGIKDEIKIRRAILDGTDIGPTRKSSKDGSQTYEITTLGNAQLLYIEGLPN